MDWTLAHMRDVATGLGWTIDSIPDPDHGQMAPEMTFDGPLSRMVLTLRCGHQIAVSSYRGFADCERQLGAIMDEIAL